MKIIILIILVCEALSARKIPDHISLGVASSSYQTEGAWNITDKGLHIWDNFVHYDNLIVDGTNADIACDSYHKYERDIEMLTELGVDHYRFSISWPRILPEGFINKISTSGIEHYDKIIDRLLQNKIEPIVTIFHWELPQVLQKLGGWSNPDMIKYYTDYADLVFELFGDRVKFWGTFNEPQIFCWMGHGASLMAPGLNIGGIAEYRCGHNMLKAHAAVYHLYEKKYKSKYNGKITIVLNSLWHEPASNSSEDLLAAEIGIEFELGWFAHPIFSKEGDYPKIFKERIAERSKLQGFSESRLPQFTNDEILEIKGTADFLGFNHYSTALQSMSTADISVISYYSDIGTDEFTDPSWPNSTMSWLKIVPWGFTKVLNWIKDNYDNPEVFVLENGYPDHDGLNDDAKVYYLASYLNALLDAVEDGCNIIGYTIWSLMDSFEWNSGYTLKFGLYRVDFQDPNRTRTIKKSGYFFRDVIENRSVNYSYTSKDLY